MTDITLRPLSGDMLGIADELESADHRARSLACGLTDAQACWRPSRSEPSVCEALEDYCGWLERTVPVVREAVYGVRSGWRARLGEVQSGWWWRLLPRLAEFAPVIPMGDATRRLAPERRAIRVTLGVILALHGELRALARQGDVRDLRTASVRLPFLPELRCPIDVALALAPAMARRHLRRAERVRLDRRFPRV